MSSNLTSLDLAGNALDTAIQACQRYLSAGEGDLVALQDRLEVCRQTLERIDPDHSVPSAGMLDRLTDSPFPVDDIEGMYDATRSFVRNCMDDLNTMEWITGPDCHLALEDKLETLECYQTVLNETLLQNAYCSNIMLLPVTADEAMEEFWYQYLPELMVVPLQASEWERDGALLESKFTQCCNREENALMELVAIDGIINQENAELAAKNEQLKESIITNYMAQGCTREEAESLLESLLYLREICLPQPEDDVNILWDKMTILLSEKFYEDARACVDAYWELAKDQPDAQKYLPAAHAFIDFCETNGLYYSVMVMAYDETAGINEALQIGDVIVAFNGEVCVSYESYVEQRAQCTENSYTLLVLRMNETGKMAPVQVELTRDMPAVYLNTVVDPLQ